MTRHRHPTRRGSLFLLGLVAGLGSLVAANVASATQHPVGLGTAGSFAVLAGTGVTNTGPSVVNGNLGTCPTPTITGFPPGIVNGTIHAGDDVCVQAKSDLVIAYNDAAGRAPTTTFPGPTDLGGMTLGPGVYRSPSSLAITGTLTLDAGGNPDATFIFQALTETLITAPNSRVVLINGAQACNVFWQVGSSATLGVGSTFVGTILALTSITANTSATVDGRLLARNGAVTLDTNTITVPTCTATSSTTSAGATSSTTPGATSTTSGATTSTTSGVTTSTTTGATSSTTATTSPSATTSTTAAGGSPVTPTVTVNPPTVLPTQNVTVTGTGFLPSEAVIIAIDNTPVATTVATPTGAISAVVPVPADLSPGAHVVTARGLTSGRAATAPLNVAGSVGVLVPSVPVGVLVPAQPFSAVPVFQGGIAQQPLLSTQGPGQPQQQQQQQSAVAGSGGASVAAPAAAAAAATPAPATAAAATPQNRGALPFTGSSFARIAMLAAGLVVYGVALLTVRRAAVSRR